MLAYIDPGTGSMLFTILLGLLGVAIYKFKDIAVKARFVLSGGKKREGNNDRPKYVVFSDHKRYWNVFKPICDEFEHRQTPILYMTASSDDPALDSDYKYVSCKFIGEGNKAYAALNTMHADILLSTTPSLDVFYWKRSKHVNYYVHIAHAASDLTLYRMFGIDFYDAILTSGDYQNEQIRALEKARNLPKKELVKVGLPFMDVMKTRLETAGNIHNKKPVVLLAPSWGPNAIFSKFGGQVIENLLKADFDIIIRPHPQSFSSEKELIDGLMQKYPADNHLEWNKDNDNFEVLRRADIMISDFSGVMFDFALVFDKPLIYTGVQFDASPYDACWLQEEPWTFRILPSLGMMLTEDNISSIKQLIDSCLHDTRFEEGREKARKETWEHMGNGAVKVADYLTIKHDQLTKDTIKENRK